MRQGLAIQPASDLPQFDPDILAANLISRHDPVTRKNRRVWELMKAYSLHRWESVGRWGCSTVSIHFNHSVPNADALHRWSRIQAALMPVYYAVFENRQRTKEGIHTGLSLRRSLNHRGLIAPYVFAATDGNDFIRRYIDFVLNNKIITALDKDGCDTILRKELSFRELPKKLQTFGNILHAASVSWNVCKIKPIFNAAAMKDGRVELSNLLLEIRDFDVSDSAVPAIAGWMCALTASHGRLDDLEAQLEALDMPLCSAPLIAEQKIKASLLSLEQSPAYLETRFGFADANISLRDTVKCFVMPILKERADARSINLWNRAADADAPVFR